MKDYFPVLWGDGDILNVTFNLNSESYYLYRKPNDWPVYIHSQSNHPPNIIKNLPSSISRRLTDISSGETAFGDAKPMYDEKAVADSGFCEKTEFLEDQKGSIKKRESKKTVVEILPGSTLHTARMFQPTLVGDSAL